VTAESKTLGSGQMFDGIAARYDFVNRVISLGIDQSWRRRTVRTCPTRPWRRRGRSTASTDRGWRRYRS